MIQIATPLHACIPVGQIPHIIHSSILVDRRQNMVRAAVNLHKSIFHDHIIIELVLTTFHKQIASSSFDTAAAPPAHTKQDHDANNPPEPAPACRVTIVVVRCSAGVDVSIIAPQTRAGSVIVVVTITRVIADTHPSIMKFSQKKYLDGLQGSSTPSGSRTCMRVHSLYFFLLGIWVRYWQDRGSVFEVIFGLGSEWKA